MIFATGITLTHKSVKCQPINKNGFTIGPKLRRTTIFLISTHLLNIDFTKLEKSKKFTPALYHEKDGIWEEGSTSRFSPVMIFKLWEKFSDSCLEVSESMEFFYLNRNSLISPGKENFCREVRILNRTS